MATGGTLIKEVQGMIDPTRSLERIWRASTGAVARRVEMACLYAQRREIGSLCSYHERRGLGEGDEFGGNEHGIGPPQYGVVGRMVSLFVDSLQSVAERPEVVGDVPEGRLVAVQRLKENLQRDQPNGMTGQKLGSAAQRQKLGALDVHLENVHSIELVLGRERIQRDGTDLDRRQRLHGCIVVTHVADLEQRVRPAVRGEAKGHAAVCFRQGERQQFNALAERCKGLLRDGKILWLGLEGDDATVWEVFQVLHHRVTVVRAGIDYGQRRRIPEYADLCRKQVGQWRVASAQGRWAWTARSSSCGTCGKPSN